MKGNGFTTRAKVIIAACGIFLSVYFVAAAGASRAQSGFSAEGAYMTVRARDLDCSVIIGSWRFGFDQYRLIQNAKGENLYTFSDVTKGVEWPRYTTVFLGPLQFSVIGPAWIVVSILAAGIGGVILFAVAGVGKARKVMHVHREA